MGSLQSKAPFMYNVSREKTNIFTLLLLLVDMFVGLNIIQLRCSFELTI